MIEIERSSGGQLLGAGVAAIHDCCHDLPLAGRLALANHGDEPSGAAGDGLCRSITALVARHRHITMCARCAGVVTWTVRVLNVVIPREWGLNAGSLRIFIANGGIANSGAVAHDRGEQ